MPQQVLLHLSSLTLVSDLHKWLAALLHLAAAAVAAVVL
jgi:hypothetical protein